MSERSAITPDQFASFGDLLKFLRRRCALSQRELSIAVGYSESQISRLEQNLRAPDDAAVAARFVPALHLDSEPAWAARLVALAKDAPATTDEPSPASVSQPSPGNLPLQLTTFVGRAEEIAQIGEAFASGGPTAHETRLLTLTGPGGVGKTRLALQVAAGVRQQFEDGVYFVDLAPITDPSLVAPTLVQALDISDQGARSPQQAVKDTLRDKRMLLVLDNLEQVVAAAPLVTELLAAAPELKVLATSRIALRLRGEREFPVSPLPLPDPAHLLPPAALAQYAAVDLFIQRATSVRPDFEVTDENASAIAAICSRLDGLPLAIELAAARVKLFPPRVLLQRLDSRLKILTGGPRDVPARQQTLRDAIAWSYELLDAGERALFRRLAVFVGGFTMDAAEVVCNASGDLGADVVDGVASLVDKSLLPQGTEEKGLLRFAMLETIREYALERLAESGEGDDVRQRHAAYFAAFSRVTAEWLYTFRLDPPLAAWLERAPAERDNLRAALQGSAARGDIADATQLVDGLTVLAWYRGGADWAELGAWAETLVTRGGSSPDRSILTPALMMLGVAFFLQGELRVSQAKLTEALHLARERGDRRLTARVLERLGWVARERDDATSALALLEESAALSRRVGDDQTLAGCLVTLGEAAVVAEDKERATPVLEEGLALYRKTGDVGGIAWALNHLGHVAQLNGEWEIATRRHQEALELFQTLSPVFGVSESQQSLGECALGQDDAALAARRFVEALALFKRYGYRVGVAWCLAGLAGTAALDGQSQRAARLWGAAESLRQSLGARPAPAARATRERLMSRVREQLGDSEFVAEWAAGQALSLEEAAAYALEPTG